MRFYSTFFVDNLLVDSEYNFAQAYLFKKSSEKLLKLYELCFNSFVHNSNKECKLIVNDISYQYIKTHTNISDNYLLKYDYPPDLNYRQVWSLPKLYCYQYLCSIGDPFLFFDLDMMLTKPICENFLSNELFAFERVPENQIDDWGLNIFINFLHENNHVNNNQDILSLLKNINFDIKNLKIPNCALFGGNNLEKINNYTNLAINNCLNEKNQNFWSDNYKAPKGFEKACILEQFLLGLICDNDGKNNILYLNEYYKENNLEYVLAHVTTDKLHLDIPEMHPELLFNVIFKILKTYKVKYYMDIYFQYNKTDFPELNFNDNEKIVFNFLIQDFFKKLVTYS